MSFSSYQQPELRSYLALAWAARLKTTPGEAAPRCLKGKRCGVCDFCGWYGDVLEAATGYRSTTQCNAGRDYDLFMAALEEIHRGSTKWNFRIFSGDVKRMLHELRKDLGAAALAKARVDERYLTEAVRHGFQGRQPWEVSRDELIIVLGEVKRHVRRRVRQAEMGEALDELAEAGGSVPVIDRRSAEVPATSEDHF